MRYQPGPDGRITVHAGVLALLAGAVLVGSCTAPVPSPSVPQSPSPSPTRAAAPTPSPTRTPPPTSEPSPSPSPGQPTLPPEAEIDVSRWTALEWRQATLELPELDSAEWGGRIEVRDVVPFRGGYLAVGFLREESLEPPSPPPLALIWRSEDGLDWRLVSDDSTVFQDVWLGDVARARDAFIAWGWSRGTFLSSVDGSTWTRTEHSGGGERFYVTETSEGLFGLALPFDGRGWTTTDGLTWSAHQTTGLDLTVTERSHSAPQLMATGFGYLLAGEAVGSGMFDGMFRWASWFSPDGVTWQEFAFVEGASMAVGGRNAGFFQRGHRFAYAAERPPSGICWDWCEVPYRRTEDGRHWELAEPAFPDVGQFDGRFSLDLHGLAQGLSIRLSEDGGTVRDLQTLGESRPRPDQYVPTFAVGHGGIALLDYSDDGQPRAWFGRAVTEMPSSPRPAAYCGTADPLTCLRLIADVAAEQSREGSAYLVTGGGLCPLCPWGVPDPFGVVAVPAGWPDSGKLRRWVFDGDRPSPASTRGWTESIRRRLSPAESWTDPVVGDQIWVQFRDVDSVSINQVMRDNSLTGPISVKPVGDVLWYAVGIRGQRPSALHMASLRRDPRVCGVDFVRFDPSVLRGEAAGELLLTPRDEPDCE